MKRKRFRISFQAMLVLAALQILLILALSTASAADDNAKAGSLPDRTTVRIVRNDETGFSFILDLPEAELHADGQVLIAGLDTIFRKPGVPALPYFTTYIALPPQATYRLDVVGTDASSYEGVVVKPVPTILLESTLPNRGFLADDNQLIESAPANNPDPLIYDADTFFPEATFAASDEIFIAGWRVFKLDLFPLRYNPGSQVMRQAKQITVKIDFAGAVLPSLENDRGSRLSQSVWQERIMNSPPESWRTAVPQAGQGELTLPVGEEVYKIEVDHDGIYKITGSELAAIGLNIANVEPDTLVMMHRGKPVAFHIVNLDGQDEFGPTDEIWFYGWAFDGTRYEDLFVSDNVYWLWSSADGKRIQEESNDAGQGYALVETFNEEITAWPHDYYYPGEAVNWDASPNEPTLWYAGFVAAPLGETRQGYVSIDLPDPATSPDAMATLLAEVTSRHGATDPTTTYTVNMRLVGGSGSTEASWENAANTNIIHQVPLSELTQPGSSGFIKYPENRVAMQLTATSESGAGFAVLLTTRLTANYLRNLHAVDNQLIFEYQDAGNHEFEVSGFTDLSEPIVWDVSDRYAPAAITIEPDDISGGDTLSIGRSHGDNVQIIATTTENLQTVKRISAYQVKDLFPPEGEGEWVAIAHESLLPAAYRLAKVRANRSGSETWQPGLSTWIVDIADIANQMGYGFNTPDAMRDFLRNALATWDEPPAYLTIFGDATVNPRNLDCLRGCGGDAAWDKDRPTLVPTDLRPVDRFRGIIQTDYTFSLLVGDDLGPDISVGRIAAEDLKEAYAAVDKIILYENRVAAAPPGMENYLFVNDNTDGGGNFCAESKTSAKHVASAYTKEFLCLESEEDSGVPLEQATEELRKTLFQRINGDGLAVLNYRGHGSERSWANPYIMHTDYVDFWQNIGRPMVIISADCLDGNFSVTGIEGLGETILELGQNRGSAAHWSSAGFGFSFEHSALHSSFFDAVFQKDHYRIGDAVNFAKIEFLANGYHESEAYLFTLQGDPAMAIYKPSLKLPIVIGK